MQSRGRSWPSRIYAINEPRESTTPLQASCHESPHVAFPGIAPADTVDADMLMPKY